MDLGIDGRAAIVTGSTRGIGEAVAATLLEEGCSVTVCGRTRDDLEATAADLRERGDVLAVRADVTDDDDVERLVSETVDAFGGVDVLVNNVGTLGSERPLHEVPIDEWEAVYDANVTGTVRATKAALPHMREQGWGRVVNVASEAATIPDDFKPHYDSSKAAVVNLTKNLSKTYGEEGVLVNAVSPATTLTPLVEELFEERAAAEGKSVEQVRREFIEADCPNIVFDRLARPEEVADVVAFLASERASYVTGSNYRVDGGSIPTIDV